MKRISLESAARFTRLVVKDFDEANSVDITCQDDERILAGTYKWDEVKQFVRELAEALDMTLEEAAPEVDPIILPKDVYEEVAEMKDSVDEADDRKEARARADRKIWKSCRLNPNATAIAKWIDTTDGATLDLAKMLMGELPFKCENSPAWVLKTSWEKEEYLSKAGIKPNGQWQLDYSSDIDEAIKFPRYTKAKSFANTISHLVYLGVKEV